MWVIKVFLAILGLSAGFTVAGGLFALIIGLGIIPRYAGRTHTGRHIMLYESCVAFGGVAGNIVMLYHISLPLGKIMAAAFGFFSGAFVGGWYMALAEIVNTYPIFIRRVKLVRCLSYLVLSIALGKCAGALVYFINGW